MRARMSMTLMGCGLGLMLTACSPAPTPDPPQPDPGPTTANTTPAASTASAGAAASPSAAAKAPSDKPAPCGELGCMQYASPAGAFAAVLAAKPLIVAVGEAHAQKGTEDIPTSTQRFTTDILPLLEKDKSDLVLELMIPDPKCKKAATKVEKNVEKPVTKTQRKTNKTEFEKLAEVAKGKGVRPHVLRPSCAQLKKVADAGDAGVLEMLPLIAHLSDELTRRILARNDKQSVDKGVILYGGAMHNDLAPQAGREKWTFGPQLSEHVKGSYVEVDLIVPEYIKDNDTWKKLPWYAHYDKAKHGDKTTLFATGPKSFTLIFPAHR